MNIVHCKLVLSLQNKISDMQIHVILYITMLVCFVSENYKE